MEHPELGEIKFSSGGHKKPISFSADERKLRLFPFLPEIIKHGNVITTEKDRYNRTQVQDWVVVESVAVLDAKPIKVRVNLRKDASGRLYYDHVISKNPSGTAYNDSQSGVLDSSIKENRAKVNQNKYDHVIAKEKSLEQRSGPATNPVEISKGVNNSIEPEQMFIHCITFM